MMSPAGGGAGGGGKFIKSTILERKEANSHLLPGWIKII